MEKELIPRKMTLTEADLQALGELLESRHNCRFNNISKEDMDFIKDLLTMYKETRSEVMKWLVKGVIYLIIAGIMLGAYFKISVRH